MTTTRHDARDNQHMTHKLLQTMQSFLPQGKPRGIRIADITTRIVQAASHAT